jgi:hypothetical protein
VGGGMRAAWLSACGEAEQEEEAVFRCIEWIWVDGRVGLAERVDRGSSQCGGADGCCNLRSVWSYGNG